MNHHKIEYTEKELESERWLPIPSYEELYEVSNLGRIRTKSGKKTINSKGIERTWKQRILKYKSETNLTYKTGYMVALWKNGEGKVLLVARLVASAFISDELNNKELTINHINGNRLDNRIENLEWCTLEDNIEKAIETGLTRAYKTILIDKRTNKELVFRSMKRASEFLHHSTDFIGKSIKRNKFENNDYSWRLEYAK